MRNLCPVPALVIFGNGLVTRSEVGRSEMSLPDDDTKHNVVRLGTETLFAIAEQLRRMYDADLRHQALGGTRTADATDRTGARTFLRRAPPPHLWRIRISAQAAEINSKESPLEDSARPYIPICDSRPSSFLVSGMSVIVTSVSNSTLATDTAFSRPMRTTLVGSMMPASTKSTYSLRAASKP
jgi:hypothetical protein